MENINNYSSKQDFIFLIFLYNYAQLKMKWLVRTHTMKKIAFQESPKHANNIFLVFNVACILCCDVALWLNVIDLSLCNNSLWKKKIVSLLCSMSNCHELIPAEKKNDFKFHPQITLRACILLWFVVERIPGIDSISCGRFDQFNH